MKFRQTKRWIAQSPTNQYFVVQSGRYSEPYKNYEEAKKHLDKWKERLKRKEGGN